MSNSHISAKTLDTDTILQIFADTSEHTQQGDKEGYCIVREHHALAITRKLFTAMEGVNIATAQPAAEVIETDCRSEEGVTVGLIDALIAICRPLATRDLATPATCAALEDLRSDSDALAIFLGLPPAADEVRRLRERISQLEKLLSCAATYATRMEPMSAKLLNAIDAALSTHKTGEEE